MVTFPNRGKDGEIEGGDAAECVPGGGTSMCSALQVGRGGGDEGCRKGGDSEGSEGGASR